MGRDNKEFKDLAKEVLDASIKVAVDQEFDKDNFFGLTIGYIPDKKRLIVKHENRENNLGVLISIGYTTSGKIDFDYASDESKHITEMRRKIFGEIDKSLLEYL